MNAWKEHPVSVIISVSSHDLFRLRPSRAIRFGDSPDSETDHFLNHSWALPGKERHAESWGTAMRNVSLFPSYAVIYDTMVVTDLIITVYFPSEGKKVKVSDFACFPFIPRLLFHRSLFFSSPHLFDRFFFFSSLLHLPTPSSFHSSHKYPFKFTNTIKNSPHQRLHCALPGIWWEGNLLIPQACFKAEKHAGNCKWENMR